MKQLNDLKLDAFLNGEAEITLHGLRVECLIRKMSSGQKRAYWRVDGKGINYSTLEHLIRERSRARA